jgi:hypothetical protein
MKAPPPRPQQVTTIPQLLALPGNPVPVSVFASMAGRNRKSVYDRIARGTLPACYLCGLLCVVVLPAPTEPARNGAQ